MNGRLRKLLPYFCGFLFLIKLVLSADIPVSIVNSPNDDLLYVARAHALLEGNGFGAYSDKTLLKLPGFSFILAAFRLLGIPYSIALNLIFAAAGYAFIRALGRCGFSILSQAFIFAIYLFNPVTLSAEWGFVLREPLVTCLFIFLIAFLLNILVTIAEGGWPWLSTVGMASTLAALVLTREEEKTLLALWIIFGGLIFYLWKRWNRPFTRDALGRLTVVVLLPLTITLVTQVGARAFVLHYYGLPILHELDEGEYPKLINALQRVRPQTRSLHKVMTRDGITTVTREIPGLRHLFEKALAETSEQDEGTLLFRLREQAYLANLTPTLIASQKLWAMTRQRVEELCDLKKLDCAPARSGFFPSWQSSDLAAFLRQLRTLAVITINPKSTAVSAHTPTLLLSERGRREYQRVTLMPDAPDPFSQPLWRGFPKELFSSLVYWARYPDVAASSQYGPTRSLQSAREHYVRLGSAEHRQWVDGPTVPLSTSDTTGSWRDTFRKVGRELTPVICIVGLTLLLLRFSFAGWSLSRPFGAFLMLAMSTLLVKLLALSYVSLYLTVAVRLLYPAHLMLCVLSLALITDSITKTIRYYRRVG